MKINTTFSHSNLQIIVDSREQLPLSFDHIGVKAKIGSLDTGDYSLDGMQKLCAIERKSLGDLVMCVGRERERFERELSRIAAYPCRAILVEASLEQVMAGGWRGKVTPQAVYGSLISWQARNIPIYFSPCRNLASKLVYDHLRLYAKRRWSEIIPYLKSLKED